MKSLTDARRMSPNDIVDGDMFAAKVVAVAGYADDWAMYIGPSDWADEEVAQSGDKLAEEEAQIFTFKHVMRLRSYRE